MRFAMIRYPRWTSLLFALGVLVVPTGAQAVSISVTSPPQGTPLTNVRPTIVISYAPTSVEVPLNVDSLQVTANGLTWTERFTKTDTSATYAVSAEDQLVGGVLVIEATIADQAGETASVRAEWEVLPSLQSVQPEVIAHGDQATVTALGLDPDPARNLAVFSLLSGPVEVPFDAVDRVNNQGLVTVPELAISANLPIRVNGKQSRQAPWLWVIQQFSSCGAMYAARALGSTSLLVHTYYWQPNAQSGTQCPSLPAYDKGHIVAIHNYDGTIEPIFGRKSVEPDVATIAVSKGGTGWAVLAYRWDPEAQEYLTEVNTATSVALLHGMTRAYEADFDAAGNLYVVGVVGGEWALVKVPAEELTPGGPATYSVLTTFGPFPGTVAPRSLAVSCQDRLYVSIVTWHPDYTYGSVVRELDLVTGAITEIPTTPGGVSGNWVTDLALTGTPGEVLGLSITDVATDWFTPRGEIWRAAPDGGVERLTPAVFPGDQESTLTVVGSGRVYVKAGWEIVKSSYQVAENPETHQYQPFPCACPSGKVRGPDQTCEPAPLVVTSETTRLKPQRADTPIEIRFTGPDDVDMTKPGRLEIQAPSPAPPILVSGSISQIPVCAAGSGRCYRLIWPGPWTYTDPNDGQVKRLPAGNYAVVVKAMAGNSSPQREVVSGPYDKVSLVEVKKVELAECGSAGLPSCQDGGAAIETNVGPGGGKAAFPDAAQQGGDYQRTVLVKAELEPNLGPDVGQVTVHFEWYDVDDPSAGQDANGNPIATDPVDNDKVDTPDNRRENADIVWSVTASTQLGGAAVSYFKVSTTQGNNYRVAASTHEPWLADLCGVVSSTTGELVHGPCTTSSNGTPLSTDPWNNEAAQRSEMLTVWRTLHLELDRISPGGITQAQLQHNGDWTRLKSKKLINKTPGVSFLDLGHDEKGDWIGAQLSVLFHAADWYPAKGNSADSVSVKVPSGKPDLLNNQRPEDITDRSYVLRDDELGDFLGVSHDLSLLKPLLEAVYVKPEEHSGDAVNPTPDLPWKGLLLQRDLILNPNADIPRDTANSAAYWAVPVVLAFEGRQIPERPGITDRQQERLDTHDPSNKTSSGFLGYSPAGAAGQEPRAVSFIESIRDWTLTTQAWFRPTISLTDMYRSNLAHETFHALSLAHRGGIMCATRKNYASDPMHFRLTRLQQAALREIQKPVTPSLDPAFCGENGATEPDCCPRRPPRP